MLICSTDSRFLLLQSNQQPMRAKTVFTLNSPVVDFCFNGSIIAAATMDHSIRLFNPQVSYLYANASDRCCYKPNEMCRIQGLEMCKMKVGSFILSVTWVEMKQHDTYLLAVSLANGAVQLYKHASMVGQFDVDAAQPVAFMVSGRFSREDDVLIMLSNGPTKLL